MLKPTFNILNKEDINNAVNVLATGMQNNPNFAFLFPEKTSRQQAIKILMQILLNDSIPFRYTYGAFINKKLVGVAIWHPPKTYELTFGRKIKAMPYLFKMMLTIPHQFSTFAKFGYELNKLHPKEPHWYLDAIAIAPEYQRYGLGSLLIKTQLATLDETKEKAYLETEIEPNVTWYQKFGFKVIGEKIKPTEQSPYFYRMLRS